MFSRTKIGLIATLALCCAALPAAATTVSAAAFPWSTVRGGTVMLHTGIQNTAGSSQAVTVSLAVTGPCAFVANAGTLGLKIAAYETRTASISYRFPLTACEGTYTLTVTVKNSSGVVIAQHKTTITITP